MFGYINIPLLCVPLGCPSSSSSDSYCENPTLAFQGCMRLFSINSQPMDLNLVHQGRLGDYKELQFDTCGIHDRYHNCCIQYYNFEIMCQGDNLQLKAYAWDFCFLLMQLTQNLTLDYCQTLFYIICSSNSVWIVQAHNCCLLI